MHCRVLRTVLCCALVLLFQVCASLDFSLTYARIERPPKCGQIEKRTRGLARQKQAHTVLEGVRVALSSNARLSPLLQMRN